MVNNWLSKYINKLNQKTLSIFFKEKEEATNISNIKIKQDKNIANTDLKDT